MRVQAVVGQRLAGIMGALYSDSFTTHEDVARQLEGVAATCRAFHAEDLARQRAIQPIAESEQASPEG